MGGIFGGGKGAAKRQSQLAMLQMLQQQQAMEKQEAQFKKQQAEQEVRNKELQAQQEAFKSQSDIQSQLAQDQAAMAEDDTTDIQIGADLGTETTRKRKRKPMSGSSALGL